MSIFSFYANACDNAAQEYYNNCCQESESGGIRHVVLVPTSYQNTLVAALNAAVSAQDETAYEQAWEDAVTNGAIVMLDTSGNYDGGAPQTAPGYGDNTDRLTGMKHTLVFSSITVIDNIAFANSLMGTSKYYTWYMTGSQIWNPGAPATIIPKKPVEQPNESEVRLEYTATWSKKAIPQHYPRPTNIMDCDALNACSAFSFNPAVIPLVSQAATPLTQPTSIQAYKTSTTGTPTDTFTLSLLNAPTGITLGTVTQGAWSQVGTSNMYQCAINIDLSIANTVNIGVFPLEFQINTGLCQFDEINTIQITA